MTATIPSTLPTGFFAADITPPAGLRDLKDLPLFRCAVGGKAQVIVTGDRHLLELKEFAGVSIVTARWLLAAEGW